MDEQQDGKAEEQISKRGKEGGPSKNTILILIGVLVLSVVGIVFYYSQRETKTVREVSSPYTLTPANFSSAPGVTQSFTASYSNPGGWESFSLTSLYIAGGGHDQWVRYHPAKNNFTFMGVTGSCAPGQTATLSSSFLTLNCSGSSASAPGTLPTVTFSLTPKPSFSGVKYVLALIATDQAGANSGKIAGNWTVE